MCDTAQNPEAPHESLHLNRYKQREFLEGPKFDYFVVLVHIAQNLESQNLIDQQNYTKPDILVANIIMLLIHSNRMGRGGGGGGATARAYPQHNYSSCISASDITRLPPIAPHAGILKHLTN